MTICADGKKLSETTWRALAQTTHNHGNLGRLGCCFPASEKAKGNRRKERERHSQCQCEHPPVYDRDAASIDSVRPGIKRLFRGACDASQPVVCQLRQHWHTFGICS